MTNKITNEEIQEILHRSDVKVTLYNCVDKHTTSSKIVIEYNQVKRPCDT